MKTLLITGALGAALLFTGCESTVVEHDHYHHGYGYHGSDAVYVDSGYGHSYGHSYGNDYRYHGDYRTADVERTNVHVNETNVTNRTVNNRTVVNHATVNQNVKKDAHTNVQPQPQTTKKGQPAPGKEKHKKDDQQ